MRHGLLMLTCIMLASSCDDCCAQWYGRWYGGGWGGYYGGASTPYSSAVSAQAQYLAAQGQAAESTSKAAISAEKARTVYLDNVNKYREMRRQQRAAIEEKEAQRIAEAKARAALRPPPQPATERYPRLASDQLDPLTGEIHWPDSLSGSEYADDRKAVEEALKSQAEFGPDERSSRIIYDAAHRMMTTRSRKVSELGAAGYASCRRFLNSLAIEGEHAQEALK